MSQVFYRGAAIGELSTGDDGQLKYRGWDCRRRTLVAKENERNRELSRLIQNAASGSWQKPTLCGQYQLVSRNPFHPSWIGGAL